MKALAFVHVGLALAAACAVEGAPGARELSITGGTLAAEDDAVVALAGMGGAYCTGTLIAPRLVLTAAHCRPDLVGGQIVFGADSSSPTRRIAFAGVRLHPDHVPGTLASDLALIVLAEAAPAGIEPVPLLERPFDAGFVGAPIRLVGYGRTAADSTDDGIRREGSSVITAYAETEFSFGPQPSQTCMGDSGGPAFIDIDGVEYLAGVTSSGDAGCAAGARDIRVDAFIAGFIGPFAAHTAEGGAGTGERCYYDANCGAGTCFAPPDAPAIGYCSPACAAAVDCPQPMACSAGGRCELPLPSPGALGTDCAVGGDCDSGECMRIDGEGQRLCSQTCLPDVTSCPDDHVCTEASGTVTGFGCLPAPAAGGCSAGSGHLALGTALLLLLALISSTARIWRIV